VKEFQLHVQHFQHNTSVRDRQVSFDNTVRYVHSKTWNDN